jgi:hypothetical protein
MGLGSLAALGKIAGLGGIAIGVLVLLIRPIVEKSKSLPVAQRAPLLRLIAVGAFGIGALGVIAWWSSNSPASPPSVSAGPCGVAAGHDASGNTVSCGAVPAAAPAKP